MKLIVVTDANWVENEHDVLKMLFKSGLRYLHVRKPNFTYSQMSDYIKKIPLDYHDRIILHSHHRLVFTYELKGIHITEKHRKSGFKMFMRTVVYPILKPKIQLTASFHKLSDLKSNKKKYRYVFLSPIFESISKAEHAPSYSLGKITDALSTVKKNVIALGGVDDTKISTCSEMGFEGVALSGYIWQSGSPVTNFKVAKEICARYSVPS